MKRTAVFFCFFLMLGQSAFATAFYKDAQLCINAYNQLWWTFESAKSEFRSDPASQLAIFQVEFPKVLDPNITFSIINLPLPPDYTNLISLTVNGITEVGTLASQTDNWGEHHVAGPFSVKQISANKHGKAVYKLTTRDVDYTLTPDSEGGGLVVYLSQKDVVCTVRSGCCGKRYALINNITDNVVNAYVIPASNTGVWTTPPVTNYVNSPICE